MIPRLLTLGAAATATGLSKRQLLDLNRKGVLPITKQNARVYWICESDLETLPSRISETGRALVDHDREMEQGLVEIYGEVPGRRV